MSLLTFTEDEFNLKAHELLKMSDSLDDNWRLNEKNSKFYLSKRQIISVSSNLVDNQDFEEVSVDDDPARTTRHNREDLVTVEYHVLFHPSYQIPVLLFNCFRENSSLIGLNELNKLSIHIDTSKDSKNNIQNIITQSEHPILFKPFFMVHPCKVNEVLSKFSESQNFILTFLTLYGPLVRLEMNPNYEKFFDIPGN